METVTKDIIQVEKAGTLYGLFLERVRRSPEGNAYCHFDEKSGKWQTTTWQEMAREVARWQSALKSEELNPGDRVAIWANNSREWVILDQAAFGLGLVDVPLYPNDRPENVAYILKDAGVKLLLIDGGEQWEALNALSELPSSLERVVSLKPVKGNSRDKRLKLINYWLPEKGGGLEKAKYEPDSLATIVYTSGTTGHPKGVMLSHHNILWDAWSGLQSLPVYREDLFLSFLPLSHTFERTVGHYIPIMAGATVAYARSVQHLVEDIAELHPTVITSVPRLFERVFTGIKTRMEERGHIEQGLFDLTVKVGWDRFEYYQQRGHWRPEFLLWPLLDRLVAHKIREKLGGRLRAAVSGGAALSPEVAKLFIGMGIHLIQGYGMTETSPIISVNPLEDNIPSSVGIPLKDVKVKIGENDELLVKSPGVMMGYWHNPKATGRIIDEEGWLHTGDKAAVEDGHIYIKGRIKEIIVMANGEKFPPGDIEMAVKLDPLIEQVMVVGEGRPYMSALVVLNSAEQSKVAAHLGLDEKEPGFYKNKKLEEHILSVIADRMHAFSGTFRARRAAVIKEPWTPENGLITPTLKLKRSRILESYQADIEELYEGHDISKYLK